MAWQERHYYREQGGFGGGLLSHMGSHSVVTWLIGINIIVWLLDMILSGGTRTAAWASPSYWGNFNVNQAILHGQIWRFITYQFLHAGFFHIFFNMIVLFFFGPMMEQWWGSKRFLAFYLLCGMAGAVVFSFMVWLAPDFVLNLRNVPYASEVPLIGASGALFGVLVGCALAYPKMQVLLIVIPMSMRTMALIFLGLAVLSVVARGADAGGNVCHLGGAALGLGLMKLPHTLDWADHISTQRFRVRHQRNQYQRQRRRDADLDAEVDRILDKVKDHGLQSLTRREKHTLRNATQRQRGK